VTSVRLTACILWTWQLADVIVLGSWTCWSVQTLCWKVTVHRHYCHHCDYYYARCLLTSHIFIVEGLDIRISKMYRFCYFVQMTNWSTKIKWSRDEPCCTHGLIQKHDEMDVWICIDRNFVNISEIFLALEPLSFVIRNVDWDGLNMDNVAMMLIVLKSSGSS